MIIQEKQIGCTKIRIHDDYTVKTPEEVQAILERLGQIVRNSDDTDN